MNWIQRFFRRVGIGRPPPHGSGLFVETEIRRVQQKIGGTLIFAMEIRDAQIGIMQHSAIVSLVATQMAEKLGVTEADTYTLQTAAHLHEVGMFAIPPELLQRPTPLTTEELERVRGQAAISARVAEVTHPPRVARLIEHQYHDFHQLERDLSERELLLAGVLRVADVFASVTWPRPYQDPMAPAERDRLLEGGAGTLFHPLAVRSVRQLWQLQ